MHLMGLDFAPINIPLERRLQTLAVFHHVSMFLFFGTGSFFLLLFLLVTPFFWITWLYAAWYVYDLGQSSRGGRRLEWMRRARIWKWMRDYFPVRLIKTADLPPDHNYIIGGHPHGVMGLGTFCALLTEANGFSELFPGITNHVLSLKLMHYLPFYREYVMALGVCDVSKESIEYLMKGTGKAVTIVVGGAKEAFDAHPGEAKLVIKNRKGFVKVAIQNGAYLVPTYSFGENEVYRLLLHGGPDSKIRKVQRFLQTKLGFAPILFLGRGIFNYTFGFLPHRKPITVVVGRPIPVERNPNPTQEEIDYIHQRYLDELKFLFDSYKAECGYKTEELEFID